MTEQEASELLKKYKDGLCTPQELAFMESWYKDLEDNLPDVPYSDADGAAQRVWQMALARQVIPQKSIRRYYWPVAAACMIIICGIVYLTSTNKNKIKPEQTVVEDAPAGSNKATLTLGNGQQIVLDAAKAGTLAQQAGVTISKNANGQLVYTIADAGSNTSGAYNTISTPKGGQFEVYLPDGSHVWLNADSRLKYPLKFIGDVRKVELTGEAYFEVKKNSNQSFIVTSNDQSVEVLGTHFNVCSYRDEPAVTTLAEGRVKVSSVSFPQKTILEPNQQATAMPDGFAVKKVRADDVIAWKDGLFVFEGTDLKDVLRQLGRWYDVKVAYNTIPDIKFYGEIPRTVNLLKVIEQIAAVSDVQLKLQEGKIMSK